MDTANSILVVDDEEEIRQLLARALQQAGFRVLIADSGEQALAVLQREPCALVVTDLRMTGMDGLELLRQVALRYPGTRGIIVTGHGSIRGAVEATKLGVDDYITKPIVIDEFMSTVRGALEQGRRLRAAPCLTPQVSSLAALTRLLAQPSTDLHETVQVSASVLASLLQGQVSLSVFDLATASEIASGAAGAPIAAGLANGLTSEATRNGASPRLLTADLRLGHGYGGRLAVTRPPGATPFATEEMQLFQVAADQLSIALGGLAAGRTLALTLRELRELNLQAVHALVRAVEVRDRYTAGHSARVARYTVALATSVGLDPTEIENLRVAALLHDVGKVGISDLLLNKPGPLTPTERARIEEHPALGCQIVAGIQPLATSIPLIMHHQERYDGLGYPNRLAAERIPYGARILAIADSFEAITATRAYRQGRSIADALDILAAGSGQQWDPALVARWRQIVGRVLEQHPRPSSHGD